MRRLFRRPSEWVAGERRDDCSSDIQAGPPVDVAKFGRFARHDLRRVLKNAPQRRSA
jgi:hypothetical protein